MLLRLQNHTSEFPKEKVLLHTWGRQSTLQPCEDHAVEFTTMLLQKKAKHLFFFFFKAGGGSSSGQRLNECTLSSLVGLGCNLWNASQGRGLEWVSNRKFWAVYAYITFLSHPQKSGQQTQLSSVWIQGGLLTWLLGWGEARAQTTQSSKADVAAENPNILFS